MERLQKDAFRTSLKVHSEEGLGTLWGWLLVFSNLYFSFNFDSVSICFWYACCGSKQTNNFQVWCNISFIYTILHIKDKEWLENSSFIHKNIKYIPANKINSYPCLIYLRYIYNKSRYHRQRLILGVCNIEDVIYFF